MLVVMEEDRGEDSRGGTVTSALIIFTAAYGRLVAHTGITMLRATIMNHDLAMKPTHTQAVISSVQSV
jgi:hypothetical protein